MPMCEDMLHEMVEARNGGGWIELGGVFDAAGLLRIEERKPAKMKNTTHIRFHK